MHGPRVEAAQDIWPWRRLLGGDGTPFVLHCQSAVQPLEYFHHRPGIARPRLVGGYARRNFLVPVPSFPSFDALNAYLEERCLERMGRQLRGHRETIGQRMERDLEALLAFPAVPYDASDKHVSRVSSLSLVRYRTNDYSVPVAYGHREVVVRGYVGDVVISCGAEVIARHPRSYERDDFVFDPVHYLPLLERKTGALDQAAPLAGWELPEEFGMLRRLLESRMGRRGKREFVQVLRLVENFRKEEVYEAVRDALRLGAISFDAIKHLVLCRIEGRDRETQPGAVPLPAQGHRDEDVDQRLHGAHVGDRAVSERSTVLLEHHLKELKLPTFLREYGKVAGQCAAEGVDHQGYLLRLSELELIDRHHRMVARRLDPARFPATKSLDTFDFLAMPSDQRQLLLPVDADYSCRSWGETIWYRRYWIGHRSAGSATEAEANGRQESTRGGSGIWYERADGADVAARQAAVGEEGQAEVANPTGPVRRGVGRGGRAPSAERR